MRAILAIACLMALAGCTTQPGGTSTTFQSLLSAAPADQAAANAVAMSVQDKIMQQCTATGVRIASVQCPANAIACPAVKLYEVQQMAVGDCAGVIAQEKQTVTGIAAFFATLGL